MKIGVTERGDAGRDYGWHEKCLRHEIDGAILITKSITTGMGERVLDLLKHGFPMVIHVGCTGWGGSWLEPGAFTPDQQLDAAKALVDRGFPISNLTIRTDPIIPTDEGIERAIRVLDGTFDRGLIGGKDKARLRFSIMDEYRHVKQRLIAMGRDPFYGPTDFQCSHQAKVRTLSALASWRMNKVIATGLELPKFHSCGEDPAMMDGSWPTPFKDLCSNWSDHFEASGCVSNADLELMGLPTVTGVSTNPQGRQFCRCLSGKTELLACKHPCKNACRYCYWRDR